MIGNKQTADGYWGMNVIGSMSNRRLLIVTLRPSLTTELISQLFAQFLEEVREIFVHFLRLELRVLQRLKHLLNQRALGLSR